MGRQKRYEKSILVRVSNDEFRQLTDRSERSALSLSRLFVESALTFEALTDEQREAVAVESFVREWAVNEVASVGNNLNQIARQLNWPKTMVWLLRILVVRSTSFGKTIAERVT